MSSKLKLKLKPETLLLFKSFADPDPPGPPEGVDYLSFVARKGGTQKAIDGKLHQYSVWRICIYDYDHPSHNHWKTPMCSPSKPFLSGEKGTIRWIPFYHVECSDPEPFNQVSFKIEAHTAGGPPAWHEQDSHTWSTNLAAGKVQERTGTVKQFGVVVMDHFWEPYEGLGPYLCDEPQKPVIPPGPPGSGISVIPLPEDDEDDFFGPPTPPKPSGDDEKDKQAKILRTYQGLTLATSQFRNSLIDCEYDCFTEQEINDILIERVEQRVNIIEDSPHFPFSVYVISAKDLNNNKVSGFNFNLSLDDINVHTTTGVDGKAVVILPPGTFELGYHSSSVAKVSETKTVVGFDRQISEIFVTIPEPEKIKEQHGISLETDSKTYSAGDKVKIVAYDLEEFSFPDPKIAFSIIDPDGNQMLMRTVYFDKSLKAKLEFVLSPTAKEGFYQVTAFSGDGRLDIDRFKVLSKTVVEIPDWFRDNARWWSQGLIGDSDFASGIEFMIKEKIIQVPSIEKQEGAESVIPDWVRNNAGWWSERLISDDEFAAGIEYLIKNGVIST